MCWHRSGQALRVSFVKKQKMDDEHENQDRSKRADDSGTSRQIKEHWEVDSQCRYQRTHCPSNGKARSHAIRKKHSAHRWNNEVAEHEKHSGNW